MQALGWLTWIIMGAVGVAFGAALAGEIGSLGAIIIGIALYLMTR